MIIGKVIKSLQISICLLKPSSYRKTFHAKSKFDLCSHRRYVKMSSEVLSKPLNVLVYTGESKEKCPVYENILNNLKFCLNPNCYLIYLLQPEQVSRDPWPENLKLLIVCCAKKLDPKTVSVFENYVKNDGRVLLICTEFEESFLSMRSTSVTKRLINANYKEFVGSLLQHGGILYDISDSFSLATEVDKENTIMFRCERGKAVVIVSELQLVIDPAVLNCNVDEFTLLKESNASRLALLKGLLCTEFSLDCTAPNIHELTPCFLQLKEKNNTLNVVDKLIATKFPANGMQLVPVDVSSDPRLDPSTDKYLVVVFNSSSAADGLFNQEEYFSSLQTETLGCCLFYIPVVGSTMNVINVLSAHEGACVVARQQVSGKGRSANKWISPVGSASFSTHFSVSLSSSLGQRLPIIQHFIGLSVIHAVRKLEGYENIDIRLKWPNDIYFGKHIKIGGILVTSTIEGDSAHIFTGCGVNVCNSQPTMCINDIISQHNSATESHLAPLTVEYLIASSLTELEKIIKDYERNGPQNFLTLYNKYWVHDKQKVTLAATNEKVTIVGLNDYGFLLVEGENGESQSLQPDGNSFDMLKNLISVK